MTHPDPLPRPIGATPLLQLANIAKREGLSARLLAKAEFLNPTGSAKDRPALGMILEAERLGLLQPGGTVLEPTSGNMGISLSALAAARGYRCILTMPDTMSPERIRLMEALGARVLLTPGVRGMSGAVEKARSLLGEIPGSWLASQFTNPANPDAHYRTTGPEIWKDARGQVDLLVAGIGTGGTLTGTGKYLKEQNPRLRVYGVEPAESPLLSKGHAGPHGIQGIGPDFVPEVLDPGIPDGIVRISTEEAREGARYLARAEGLLAGISSGAALQAALYLARKKENRDATIVVILPDSGERYLSTGLFMPG